VEEGQTLTALKPFDDLMLRFMERNDVPGCSLAVGRNGKLIYARGFGFADPARPVTADSLFRIASVSKPITAVALLQLVQAKKVSLDDPVLKYVRADVKDRRWQDVTVRHCLQHRSGMDRELRRSDRDGRPDHARPQCFVSALPRSALECAHEPTPKQLPHKNRNLRDAKVFAAVSLIYAWPIRQERTGRILALAPSKISSAFALQPRRARAVLPECGPDTMNPCDRSSSSAGAFRKSGACCVPAECYTSAICGSSVKSNRR
jgi:hypothetical protein